MATDIGDLVLVHYEETPVFYARIQDIVPDSKPEWWQVTMLVLAMPAQEVTWTLREAYINGETFTMGGQPVRMERVPGPRPKSGTEPAGKDSGSESDSKVVSLFDRKP